MQGEFGGQATSSETEDSYSNDLYTTLRRLGTGHDSVQGHNCPAPKFLLSNLCECYHFCQKTSLSTATSRTDMSLPLLGNHVSVFPLFLLLLCLVTSVIKAL